MNKDRLAKLHEQLKKIYANDMPPLEDNQLHPDKLLRIVMANSMAIDLILQELLGKEAPDG